LLQLDVEDIVAKVTQRASHALSADLQHPGPVLRCEAEVRWMPDLVELHVASRTFCLGVQLMILAPRNTSACCFPLLEASGFITGHVKDRRLQ
jgi:hypothetical protein